MAGAMKKMAVFLGFTEDDQYDDDYGYEQDTRSQANDRPRRDERADMPVRDRNAVTVSERSDDTRQRISSDRPARDWRTETVLLEPVSGAGAEVHPAGTRRPDAPSRQSARPTSDLTITTLHPRSYTDARRIGEEFRAGSPVIMNLSELDDADAKRLVDFAAGLIFGLKGSIERIANKVFMLTPANVQLSADAARARIQQDAGRR